jgi:BlaI family transcriptional regulator, penicillinase repressor
MANQDQAPPHLGELEQAIMEVLWQRQQATVREVVGALPRKPPLAYTTVATVMSRLVEKGLLLRSRSGKVDLYRPVYDSAEFSRRAALAAVQRLVREYGDAALAQFAAVLEQADPERIARLRARYQPQAPDDVRRPAQEEDRDADV